MRPPTMPVPMKVENGPYTGTDDATAMSRATSRGVNVRPPPSRKKPGVNTIEAAGKSRNRCCSSSIGKPARKSIESPCGRLAAWARIRASHSRSHGLVPVTTTRRPAAGCQRSACSTVPTKS